MIDKQVFEALKNEELRQREGLELIPSENYVSREVLAAVGSVFTNKYSEGYPGRRYYGGQENTDIVEALAIERAKQRRSSGRYKCTVNGGGLCQRSFRPST